MGLGVNTPVNFGKLPVRIGAEAGGSDGGNAGNIAAIPSFFIVKTLNDKTRFGFSVTAPMGGGMNYGDDFVGRYGAQKVMLSGMALSPSLGYRINDRLSIGAGLSVLYTLFDETIAINNPGALPDSKVKIENMDDWEDWSEFSDNFLHVEGGTLNPSAALDRGWKDTWHLGVAAARRAGPHVYSMGLSYDSSPVSDGRRTIDLPMDSQLSLSAGVGSQGSEHLSYSLGATLMYGVEGKVDQVAQGVRFKGEFDTNLILFVGGSIRYVF